MGKLNWWLIMNEKRLFDLREYKDLSQIKLADYLGKLIHYGKRVQK